MTVVDFFVNAEYIDTEREIDLISLGIIAADGREFYAISTEFDRSRANEFVRTDVFPRLEPAGHPAWMTRERMRAELLAFIGADHPRFWSWLAAPYDFMVIAQLFAPAERVPDGWRYTAYDVSLLVEHAGLSVEPLDPRLPQAPPNVHHALADARWVRDLYRAVTARQPRLTYGGVTDADCYTCAREAELDDLSPRERIAVDEHWRVVHATGCGLLGWLVLTPRRHVRELADLTDEEASGLGTWQVRLARALTAELGESAGATKVYVAEFGEKPGFHLHFHVVPRAADLSPEKRGPGIFGYLNQPPPDEIPAAARDELARRLAARLANAKP